MSEKRLKPASAQNEAVDPKRSVWVTANAGSGKTHVLVERVIRLMLDGAEPASILCITYTKAAAAEMSARLLKRLGRWTCLDDKALLHELSNMGLKVPDSATLVRARQLFTEALETPGGLKVQTIHAFCEKLLHLFPVEAGLPPGFRILDERKNQEMREDAIGEVLKSISAEPNSELFQSLKGIGTLTNSDSFARLIDELLSGTKGLRNLLGAELSSEGLSLALKKAFGLSLADTTQSITDLAIQTGFASYLHHASVLGSIKIHARHDTAKKMTDVATQRDKLSALKQLFLTGDRSKFRESLIAKKTAEDYPETNQFLLNEKTRLGPLFEKLLLCERIEATACLFAVAKSVHQRLEQQKKTRGFCDFDDLISRCARLLSNSRAAQWVLYKLDAGLKHILVDEAQDTSPAQWQIVRSLADEFFSGIGTLGKTRRTLFVVGDRKQSIFSFQGADTAAFAAARDDFATKITGSGCDFEHVDLSISYRSTREILDAVDLVFPPASPIALGFAADGYTERNHTTARKDEPGVVEIWPIYEPLEKQEEQPWLAPVDRDPATSPRRRLARDIVSTIKSWVGKRELVSQKRSVRPDDILILLQSRGPLFAMLIAELRRAHVPVSGADRLKLLESLAVQDFLALLQWLILPEDDYSLACVLKSPLVPEPVSEDRLFELAYGRGKQSLWLRLESGSNKNFQLLARWRGDAQNLSPFSFLSQVLVARRKAMIARLGAEAKDATDALLDQALAYEQENGSSLSGFLHWFSGQQIDLKRELEKDSGEVRLMTVHGAKGLEANIIFLADAGSIPKSNGPSQQIFTLNDGGKTDGLPFWGATGLEKSNRQKSLEEFEKQRARAERNRLLYVAMTRARDELYICGIGSEGKAENDSWYETISKALVKPGTFGVVRFGPEPIYRNMGVAMPIENQALPAWTSEPAQPELPGRIHGVTGLAGHRHINTGFYDIVAAMRGVAIHALLQHLPDMSSERREIYARRKARTLSLDEAEVASLLKLLQRPDLAVFWGADSRSEAELHGVLEDGRQIAGRVDRIVIKSGEIFLLDYKSDRFVPESLLITDVYAQQMALYTQLLEQAYPSHDVKAALLWTQTGKLEWLSKAFLTQARDQALEEHETEPS